MRYQVIYFTRTGNSKRVAQKIATKLNVDPIQISDHQRWEGFIGYMRAGFFSMTNKRVKITVDHDVDPDATLIVVTPLWAGGIASATRAFLSQYEPSRVHLIITSIGSVLKNREGYLSVTDIIERSNHEDSQIETLINQFV